VGLKGLIIISGYVRGLEAHYRVTNVADGVCANYTLRSDSHWLSTTRVAWKKHLRQESSVLPFRNRSTHFARRHYDVSGNQDQQLVCYIRTQQYARARTHTQTATSIVIIAAFTNTHLWKLRPFPPVVSTCWSHFQPSFDVNVHTSNGVARNYCGAFWCLIANSDRWFQGVSEFLLETRK